MSDKIRLPSGAVIANGQLHQTPPVIGERDQTTRKIGRDATRSKNVGTVPIAHGMRDVSAKGHGLAFKGGKRPLDDEPLQKNWADGKSVPIHDGMATHPRSAHERGIVKDVTDGSKHLAQAGRICHFDRQGRGHDESLIGHRVKPGAALPPSKHRTDGQVIFYARRSYQRHGARTRRHCGRIFGQRRECLEPTRGALW